MIVEPSKFAAAVADSDAKQADKLKLTEGELVVIRTAALQFEAAKAQAQAWQLVLEGHLQILADVRGILPKSEKDPQYMISRDFTRFELTPPPQAPAPKVSLAGVGEMKHVAAQADATKKLTVVGS